MDLELQRENMNLDINTLKEVKKKLQSEMELVWSDNDPNIYYNQGIEHCISIIEYLCDEVTLK